MLILLGSACVFLFARTALIGCLVMGVSEVEQSNLKGLFCYCVIAV